ncbi:hypothetical protein OIV83_001014 [Microbotryomycetes sp. JL201]|nr:hypothetical protein OIV83_001014 [Microbotryomycetes sp. JL201]
MPLHSALALTRTVAYGVLILSSFLAWILAAAFIGQSPFYYESPVVVLVAGLFAFLALPPLHFLIHRRNTASILGSVGVEVVILFVLWMLFVGGAGGMADRLPGLTSRFCDSNLCGLGRATMAFAWISWICLTVLLGLALYVLISNSRNNTAAWREPLIFGNATTTSSKGVSSNSAPAPQMQQQPAQSYPPTSTATV